MHVKQLKINPLTLLLIPAVSAVLALWGLGFLFKAGVAASSMFILVWLYVRKAIFQRDIWAIFAAFLFSIAGDWFLCNRNGETSRFIMGIVLFFGAHVGYLVFGLLNGRLPRLITLLILVTYLGFYFFLLSPGIGVPALQMTSLCYLLISCVSLGAALGAKGSPAFRWLYITGIALILFSDTSIALHEFMKYNSFSFLILPTYYLAQISITAALISRIF